MITKINTDDIPDAPKPTRSNEYSAAMDEMAADGNSFKIKESSVKETDEAESDKLLMEREIRRNSDYNSRFVALMHSMAYSRGFKVNVLKSEGWYYIRYNGKR